MTAIPTKWVPIIACALCLAVAGNPMTIGVASLFVVPMTEDFGWTRGQFFAGIAVETAVSAIVLPFVGQLVDRRGARAAILPGILIFATCIALLATLNGSWPIYLTLMGVIGAAAMLHGPVPYTRVALTAAGSRRGFALAVAISGVTIGLILVPPICSAIIENFGWRVAQLCLSGLVLVVALPAMMLGIRGRHEVKGGTDPVAAQPQTPFPWAELRSPLFWMLGIAIVLNAIALHAYLGHVAAIALERKLSIATGALAASTFGIGSAVARLAAGYLLDRVRTPQVGQLWFAATLAGLMVAAMGTGTPSIILASALIGAAAGAEGDLIAYFTSRFFAPGLYGRMYGLLLPFFMAGASLGPLALALAYDHFNDYAVGLYVMAAAQLIGCAFLLKVGPYRYGLGGERLEADQPIETGAPMRGSTGQLGTGVNQ